MAKQYAKALDITMRDLPQYLRLAARANVMPYIEGAPGLGKSGIVETVAAEVFPGLPLKVIIGSQTDPSELVGKVVRDENGRVVTLPPAWVVEMNVAGGGVVFIDEVNDAPRSVMAALQRITHTGFVGDTRLPAPVWFVVAGNAPEYSTVGVEISPAFANRCGMHFRCVKPDLDFWIDWLSATFADGSGLRAAQIVAAFHRANARESIVAEDGSKGSDAGTTLFAFPSDESARSGAWASPRSWEKATRILAATYDAAMPVEFAMSAVRACVGEVVGTKFATFLKTANLPNPRDLLDGSVTYQFAIARADLASAVLAAVASEATRPGSTDDKATRARLVERAWEILGEAADAGLADYAVLAARALEVWRLKSSGAPLASGVAEKKQKIRFLKTSAAAIR